MIGKRIVWTPELFAKVEKLRGEGLSWPLIAERFGRNANNMRASYFDALRPHVRQQRATERKKGKHVRVLV